MITLDTTFKRAVLNIIFCVFLWVSYSMIGDFLELYLNYDEDDLGFWHFCGFLITGFTAICSLNILEHPKDKNEVIAWGFVKFRKPKKLSLKQRILNVFYYLLISGLLCFCAYYFLEFYINFLAKFIGPIIFVHTIFVYRNKVSEWTEEELRQLQQRKSTDNFDPFDDSNYSPHDYKRRNIGNKTMMGYD